MPIQSQINPMHRVRNDLIIFASRPHGGRMVKLTPLANETSDVPRLSAHETLPAREMLSVSNVGVEMAKLNEIAQLIAGSKNGDPAEVQARVVRALELVEQIAPRDVVEGMLAEQMVGTHLAAMECLRRAALAGQSPEARDQALRHAARFMALYTQQMAALDKHRGKGQQRVTVEHVHVAAGGQAIVGHVETGGQRRGPPALEKSVAMPFEIDVPQPVEIVRNGAPD